MRWQRLFGDLETQFDREADLERRDELRDEVRRRLAATRFVDVLGRAAEVGENVEVILDGCLIRGLIRESGSDWIALSAALGGLIIVRTDELECVVPSTSTLVDDCASVAEGVNEADGGDGPDPWASEPRPAKKSPVPLTFVQMLGRLARRRVPVSLHVVGRRVDGTLRAVGRDWVELRERPAGDSRASSVKGSARLVAMSRISAVGLWTVDAPPRW